MLEGARMLVDMVYIDDIRVTKSIYILVLPTSYTGVVMRYRISSHRGGH